MPRMMQRTHARAPIDSINAPISHTQATAREGRDASIAVDQIVECWTFGWFVSLFLCGRHQAGKVV